ncbi:SHOCT domain-containing protein [Georgenia daeguensis]|uniref:SHOCT domain-containing protein n=1 Tax=Georgenia daeguensis TaxID=908355 RepID=A0ABP8EUP9_9MICO
MFSWDHMGWWMGLGWLWVILLVVLVGVVVLVAVLARGQSGGAPRTPEQGRSSARAILDERYARGEIDTAEYQERLRALGGK